MAPLYPTIFPGDVSISKGIATSTYLLRGDGHPPIYPWGDGIYLGGDGTLLFSWRGWPRLTIYLGQNLLTYLLISRRRWPPNYLSRRRWPPTYLGGDGHLYQFIWEGIYLLTYLGGDGHPNMYLRGDGHPLIYLGGDGHLNPRIWERMATNSFIQGAMATYLHFLKESIYISICFIYPRGDGHPPTCLGGDGNVYLFN